MDIIGQHARSLIYVYVSGLIANIKDLMGSDKKQLNIA
jgi:hypothetical protein